MSERLDEEFEKPIDVEQLDWPAPVPPTGFAAKVVEALQRDTSAKPAKVSRLALIGVVGIGALGTLAAAVMLLWYLRMPTDSVEGSLQARQRQSVRIHDRAIAVAESGTNMRWAVEADGTARVEQDSGRVFYRVDDGRTFEVTTPMGTVEVTGTCFEVEMKPMNRQMLKAGAAGAALATAVFVTVYEGQVVLANDKGEVTLDAGDRGRASNDDSPSRFGEDDDGTSSEDANEVRAVPASVDPMATVRRQGRDLERLRAEKMAQLEEIEALRAQVESLGGTPEGLSPEAKKQRARKCAIQSRNGDCPFLDPDQETLEEMARCATVKYDYPSFLQDFDVPQTQGYAENLGVTDPAEAQALQAAAEKHHASYNDALREIYLELGGDPDQAGDASAKTLTAFIEDQLDRQLAADVQRKIAQERAGLREPPPAGAELPIEEQFWRMRAELGNDFERHVAESLGPERARKLRGLNDGWPGSTSVHSGDCVETP